MKLPIARRMRKKSQVDVAFLQDEIADILYSIEQRAVIHGGTAIWRCYDGKRFSEDLDFYAFGKDLGELPAKAESRGIKVLKFRMTDNLLFAGFSDGEAEVRLEVDFAARKAGALAPFERTDGSSMQVFSLTPEELIVEKIAAYRGRRLIRDLYDIAHLSGLVKAGQVVARPLSGFLSNVATPLDEQNLKAIVYSGAIPTYGELVSSLRRRWG
ncbi:nucleotidyl transferase AbiEii/AbiGii toxin family protein [Candidatus Micrarchaeota archaeon]|nr:nucleotidyl transferase AbiEii/AbiGii toxin family protein [Candidatus Micrarchaeota archaeon]